MKLPNGYYVVGNSYPIEYVETGNDREEQWQAFKRDNEGRMVHVFESWEAAKKAMDQKIEIRQESINRHGNAVDPADICEAYVNVDESLPDDPPENEEFLPGTYRQKLTKKLLFSLPTGTRLTSCRRGPAGFGPAFEKEVPQLSHREGFWLEIKNQGLEHRTFYIEVPE